MRDLTIYRLANSGEQLGDSKMLLENGSFKGSINRSYYAIFTAVRALLAENEIDFKKHSAVISYFSREYVKTGIFDKKFAKYIQSAFNFRHASDYGDFIIASREEAEAQYLHAVEFYEAIKKYLAGLITAKDKV